MKVVLFCKKSYAFGIMLPLYKELQKQGHHVIWYFSKDIINNFPDELKNSETCDSIKELLAFNADANFAPGNDFPHYLPGVKVQIFHGMAGEKSGHFHIRHYFDLYLTQGPYFTERFSKLQKKFKNFEVSETGWSKLDTLFTPHKSVSKLKPQGFKNIILYAPTFSPSLSSATKYKNEIISLSEDPNIFLYIKFHDKMDKKVVKEYTDIAKETQNMEVFDNPDIIPMLQTCDLMISDTSSVVYEFLLLDKPVITFESTSENIRWDDLKTTGKLKTCLETNLTEDPHKIERKWFIDNYHPYLDGNSSARMIESVKEYITINGVPTERKIPFLRRRKMNKTFGKKPSL